MDRRCPVDPVCHPLAKSAADSGRVPCLVSRAEVLQSPSRPFPHRQHHCLLVHLEFAGLVELEQSLPGIPEAVGPLAGVAVLLVPDELLRPQPPLLLHLQHKLNDVRMTFAANCLFFDVQDERPIRLENTKQFGRGWQKPFDVLVWVDTSVRVTRLSAYGGEVMIRSTEASGKPFNTSPQSPSISLGAILSPEHSGISTTPKQSVPLLVFLIPELTNWRVNVVNGCQAELNV